MTNTPVPAPTPQSLPPTQTAQEKSIVLSERSDSQNRERIAFAVLAASIFAIFAISIGIVLAAKEEERDTVAQQVMSSTLPLYGTWVGTILAFYFSRNAFEAAATASDRNATTLDLSEK